MYLLICSKTDKVLARSSSQGWIEAVQARCLRDNVLCWVYLQESAYE